MELPAEDGETIAVSAYKPRSLERAASGRITRLVLTKRGRPIAVLVPAREPMVQLHGALRELMEPVDEVDLTGLRPARRGRRSKAEALPTAARARG
jgi:prevent-host-death family protein